VLISVSILGGAAFAAADAVAAFAVWAIAVRVERIKRGWLRALLIPVEIYSAVIVALAISQGSDVLFAFGTSVLVAVATTVTIRSGRARGRARRASMSPRQLQTQRGFAIPFMICLLAFTLTATIGPESAWIRLPLFAGVIGAAVAINRRRVREMTCDE
jgi:hypothetical protein